MQQSRYKAREAAIKAQAVKELAVSKQSVREQFRPQFQTLFNKHEAQLRQFMEKEKRLLGRLHNALKMVDLKAIITGNQPDRTRRQALTEAFDALSSAGVRLEALKREHAKEKRVLEIGENKAEREAAAKVRAKRDEALERHRGSFETERNDLVLKQRIEGSKVRADWKTRNEQRSQAWEKSTSPPSGRSLDPDQSLAEKLRLIEAFRVRMKGKAKERDIDRDR